MEQHCKAAKLRSRCNVTRASHSMQPEGQFFRRVPLPAASKTDVTCYPCRITKVRHTRCMEDAAVNNPTAPLWTGL